MGATWPALITRLDSAVSLAATRWPPEASVRWPVWVWMAWPAAPMWPPGADRLTVPPLSSGVVAAALAMEPTVDCRRSAPLPAFSAPASVMSPVACSVIAPPLLLSLPMLDSALPMPLACSVMWPPWVRISVVASAKRMPPLWVDCRLKPWPAVVARLIRPPAMASTVIWPVACRLMLAVPDRLSSRPRDTVLSVPPAPWLASPAATLASVALPSWLPPDAASVMRRSVGSSSSWPVRPCGARRSAVPVRAMSRWLETSAKPPSPPCTPPRAEMLPPKRVRALDHRVTWPPSPACSASACSRAPAATVVCSLSRA